MATIRNGDIVRKEHAFNIFDWNADPNCALVVNINGDRHELSISPMGGSVVSVPTRVFNAVESANGQIKSGNRYLAAPGIVLMVPGLSSFLDGQQIAAAVYGRLIVYINVTGQGGGQMQHGPDAAFQSEKNRNISAVIMLRRDGVPGMYFPNLYAHHPLDPESPLLVGIECYPPAAAAMQS
jgi:hypothetical protein